MTDCTTCGTALIEGAQFCGTCGTDTASSPGPFPSNLRSTVGNEAEGTQIFAPITHDPHASATQPPPPPPGAPGGYGTPAPPPGAPGPGGYGAPPPPPPGAPGGYGTPAPPPGPGYPQSGAYPASGPYGAVPPGSPPGAPPGYTPTPPASGGGGSGKKLLLIGGGVIVVLVLVLAAALVLPQVFGGDDEAAPDDLLSLDSFEVGPTSEPDAEAVWTVEADCEEDDCELAAGAGIVVLGVPDDDETVFTAYRESSGEEAWDEPVSVDREAFAGVLPEGVLIGSSDEIVLLDLEDGSEIWNERATFISGLTEDHIILVESDDDGATSRSQVVETATGDPLFSFDGQVSACGSDFIGIDEDDELSLLDDDGEPGEWNVDLDIDGSTFPVSCSGDLIAYFADDDEVTIAELRDGEVLGTIDADGNAFPSIAFDGDTVLLFEDDDISAHTVGDGSSERLWKVSGPEFPGSVRIVGDNVLVVDSGEEAELFSLDDGSSQGRVSFSDEDETAITPETLLAFGGDTVEAFSLDDLSELWSFSPDDFLDVGLSGDRLFTLTEDELLAFR